MKRMILLIALSLPHFANGEARYARDLKCLNALSEAEPAGYKKVSDNSFYVFKKYAAVRPGGKVTRGFFHLTDRGIKFCQYNWPAAPFVFKHENRVIAIGNIKAPGPNGRIFEVNRCLSVVDDRGNSARDLIREIIDRKVESGEMVYQAKIAPACLDYKNYLGKALIRKYQDPGKRRETTATTEG